MTLRELGAALLISFAIFCGQLTTSVAIEPPKVGVAKRSVMPVKAGNALGTATYIGNGLFVGCYHVVEGEETVEIGRWVCDVIAVDKVNDISICRSRTPVVLPAVKLAPLDSMAGDIIYGIGYGVSYNDEDGLKTINARIYGGVTTHRFTEGSPQFSLASSWRGARAGDSGGAVVNHKGELVGVIWARDASGRKTYFVNLQDIKKLLKDVKPIKSHATIETGSSEYAGFMFSIFAMIAVLPMSGLAVILLVEIMGL